MKEIEKDFIWTLFECQFSFNFILKKEARYCAIMFLPLSHFLTQFLDLIG